MNRRILQLVCAIQCVTMIACAEPIENRIAKEDAQAPNLPAEIAREFKSPFRLDKNKSREIAPNGTTYLMADYGWRITILRDSNGKQISITIVYPHFGDAEVYQVFWSSFSDEQGWLKGTGKTYRGRDADSMALLVHSILGKGYDKKLDRLAQQIQKRSNKRMESDG